MFSRMASEMREELGMGVEAGAGEGTESIERDGGRPEGGGG